MSTLIVIQARLGSSRLPGKTMLDLVGQPLIYRMYERVAQIKTPAQIVIATTTDNEDDALYTLCGEKGLEVFRGHPTDLLDRHYQAALAYQANLVVKIPSDCPLIDPQIIDLVFSDYFTNPCDFVSNLHPASFPDGNDVEIMTFETLASAWREAKTQMEREHTTPFIWERPERFNLRNIIWQVDGKNQPDLSMTHRWTIDYPEDYEFIRSVYEALYPHNPQFGLYDILNLLEEQPTLRQINEKYAGVNWYRNHLDELKTIDPSQTRSI